MQPTQLPGQITSGNKTAFVLVSILFFLSGATGLIYQTVWVRLLELYFGVTLTAITLIVSAYMAGLGLGSMLGGRIASRSKNTVLLYGSIEVGIGVFGIFSPALINWIGLHTAGSPYYLVFLLSFVLLLLPTLLMGMTLPLLTQAFVTHVESSGRVIGILYGINTLGAALGALISGYILMGWFGFDGALRIAVGMNFLIGLGAIPLKTKQGSSLGSALPQQQSNSKPSIQNTWDSKAVLGSAFLVGFIGMGFEMLWIRLLGIFTQNTAYSFPSILFTFLVALALGGWYWGARADQSKDPVKLFWKLQISIGLVTASSFLLLWILINMPELKPWLEKEFSTAQHPIQAYIRIRHDLIFSKKILLFGLLEYFIPILILIIPAGLLMGGGLPILDRISIDQVSHSGRRVGDIHLANIAGSVTGTFATSFILLPVLGSELTFKILSLLTFSFLLFAASTGRASFHKGLLIPLLGMLLLMLFLPGRQEFYSRVYKLASNQNSVVVHEGNDTVLAVTFRGEKTDPAELWIGGIQNSFFPSSGSYELTAMTCASVNHPKRILLIGLGGANTAHFLTTLPDVEEVVIVELIQNLDTLLDQYVPVAQSVFDQLHVRYMEDDGRRYLYANPGEKFDLIFIDPLWSFTAGHNNLYSKEAMQLYQNHLTPNGVFCTWINEIHLIPKTAASVFPYSERFESHLVNSNQPIEYNMQYMTNVYNNYINAGVDYVNAAAAADIMNPEVVMKLRDADRSQILMDEASMPILTDRTPWLEYYYLCPPKLLGNLEQIRYCYQWP